jgi:hypothetical protein
MHTMFPARVVVVVVVVAFVVVVVVVEEVVDTIRVVVDVVVSSNPGITHPQKRSRITIQAAYCFMIGYFTQRNKILPVFSHNRSR